MEISNWKGSIKDISIYPAGVKSDKESVMANAVNAANYDLLSLIRPGDRVLEIGCGADSWLKNNLSDGVSWEGIDVYEKDSRDRQCIATRIGSVHEIPFCNGSFDWVLANQSMEHWFEYGVQMRNALGEIARVLKEEGQAYLNFPLYLHGHPFFVQGDMTSILGLVDEDIWDVIDIIAYKDSKEKDYKGWRRCGFPDFYVHQHGKINTSFVVNLIIKKISSEKDEMPKNPETRKLNVRPRVSPIKMALMHGPSVLIWKIMRKLVRGRTGG
jgi:SAM-dependent methyltransferase